MNKFQPSKMKQRAEEQRNAEADEAMRIAIVELAAVEREIGVPSKALPLLRNALGKESAP